MQQSTTQFFHIVTSLTTIWILCLFWNYSHTLKLTSIIGLPGGPLCCRSQDIAHHVCALSQHLKYTTIKQLEKIKYVWGGRPGTGLDFTRENAQQRMSTLIGWMSQDVGGPFRGEYPGAATDIVGVAVSVLGQPLPF